MPYMLSIDSVWEAPEDDEANIAWTRAFWERMKPHSDRGRIYLNFPGLGEEGEELVRRSYGANFARLGEVKRKYDPLQRLPLQSEHQARLTARHPSGNGQRRGASMRSLIGPVVSKRPHLRRGEHVGLRQLFVAV